MSFAHTNLRKDPWINFKRN